MELETAKKLIKQHIQGHSDFISRSIIAERYFRNKNDILFKDIHQDGRIENPLRNADNRIPRNFYGLLVNQKASYLFTAPPLFDVGSNSANLTISDILGDSYAKVCKDLCINASNSGVGWLHYWCSDEKQFEYAVVDSKQIIPVWSTHLNKKLLAVLRVYKNIDDEGSAWDIYEYWTDKECSSYKKPAGELVEEALQPYMQFSFYDGLEEQTNIYTHEFARVPFIPFFNNNINSSDLDNVKLHIDAYDKVYSGFVNDLEDIQEVIFLLTNYGGEDLNQFLSEIKKYKTVEFDSAGPDDKSGLSTLTIDIPVEAREKLLDMTRKAIFEQGQGVDPQPQDFGNASGVALKYLYSLLELKAGLMETEFKLGFGELVRAICRFENLECKKIIQTWTRTAITNDSELADICNKSVGVISNKTIIKNHPFVEDADAELKELEKEKGQELDSYPDLDGKGGEED